MQSSSRGSVHELIFSAYIVAWGPTVQGIAYIIYSCNRIISMSIRSSFQVLKVITRQILWRWRTVIHLLHLNRHSEARMYLAYGDRWIVVRRNRVVNRHCQSPYPITLTHPSTHPQLISALTTLTHPPLTDFNIDVCTYMSFATFSMKPVRHVATANANVNKPVYAWVFWYKSVNQLPTRLATPYTTQATTYWEKIYQSSYRKQNVVQLQTIAVNINVVERK